MVLYDVGYKILHCGQIVSMIVFKKLVGAVWAASTPGC